MKASLFIMKYIYGKPKMLSFVVLNARVGRGGGASNVIKRSKGVMKPGGQIMAHIASDQVFFLPCNRFKRVYVQSVSLAIIVSFSLSPFTETFRLSILSDD